MKIIKKVLFLFVLVIANTSFAQYGYFEDLDPNFYNPELYKVVRDTNGFKITESFFRNDSSQLNWIKEFVFDERGNLLQEANKDTTGIFKDGVACSAPLIKCIYDEENNPIEITYWDNENKKGNHDCLHFHKEKRVYNKKHQMVQQKTFAINNRVLGNISYRYNKQGNKSQVTFLDEEDKPFTDRLSKVKVSYDDDNREVRRIYLNYKGKKDRDKEKIYMVTTEYFEDYQIETFYNYEKEQLKKQKVRGGMAVTITEEIK